MSNLAVQCFQKWRKIQLDREKGRAWSAAEDQQLLQAVKLIQTDECLGVSWNAVAHHVPGSLDLILNQGQKMTFYSRAQKT